MILTGAALTDFKVVAKAEVDVTPLTILIGPNNAGKSTVLQALALLSQSARQGSILMRSQALDLGATSDVLIRQGGDARSWGVRVSWRATMASDHPVAPGSPIDVSFTYLGGAQGAWVSAAKVTLEAPSLHQVMISVTNDSAQRVEARIHSDRYVSNQGPDYPAFDRDISGVGNTGSPWAFALPAPVADAGGYSLSDMSSEDNVVNYALAVTAPILREGILIALRGFRYIGPQRGFFNTTYMLQDNVPASLDRADEIATALAYDRELLAAVAERAQNVLGYGLRFDLIPQRNIDLTAIGTEGVAASLGNMGSGLGQVVWMAMQLEDHVRRRRAPIANIGHMEPGVGIEEPELHLHPRAQHAMAEMLRGYAAAGLRMLITTQSEHLLIAFLNQVARKVLNPNDLTVYFVNNGQVERLAVSDRGSLQGGLKGFFEANEDELLSQLEALIRQEGGDPPPVSV